MEVSEGFASSGLTMLRRVGAFRKGYYLPSVIPHEEDEGDRLKHKWLCWVEQESFKRQVPLPLRLLMNEMRNSIAFTRGPMWSGLEISFSLPAARDLWDAETPEQWKAIYLSKPNRSVSITLIEAVADASKLRDMSDVVDMDFVSLAITYMLWGRVWSYTDSTSFSLRGGSSVSHSPGSLWIEAHRQELKKQIETTTLKLQNMKVFSPEARLVSELSLMFIHTSSDDVQKFAGRYGDAELRQVQCYFREWIDNENEHHTLWHAGQVIKAVRSIPHAQVGGFHAIAAYHACLCIWMFTMLKHNMHVTTNGRSEFGLERSQENLGDAFATADSTYPSTSIARGQVSLTQSKPRRIAATTQQDIPRILLDGDYTADVEMFLRTGFGSPFVHVAGRVEELDNPKIIHMLLMDVFKGDFHFKAHLAPLLENLIDAAEELSNA
ncbi:hypothetical protein TGAMA5MH_04636 [Trichoderma gamsii]|uniref:Transcription factor domain-containing protein n=1 Tax=Trichoderma gamsii TaxID=398673 RepID=A0A2K0TDR3_9HYPO|nr:hypothetical protein TGAMA5MH_04636 [Trichoderma gamsii]